MAARTRWTVEAPTPIRRAVSRMPFPDASNARIASAFSSSSGGRPRWVPLALVRSSPAMTRERINDRSNSAKTPSIWNIILPLGVLVSRAC